MEARFNALEARIPAIEKIPEFEGRLTYWSGEEISGGIASRAAENAGAGGNRIEFSDDRRDLIL